MVQLSLKTRSKIAKIFKGAASVMMSDIVKTSDGTAVLRPEPKDAKAAGASV